jgi:Putative porin
MNNPLITFTDDLMWDPDLTPEGVAAKWQIGNDFVTFLANGEGLYIQQYDTANNATGVGGQGALKFKFTPKVALLVGGYVGAFQNIKGNNVIDWQSANSSYGNSTIPGSVSGGVTNKAWADGFTPVEGFAELDVQVGLPLSFYGQLLTNPSADDNKNGYMGGLSLGKAKNPRTWEVGYNYVKLEKDATLGMFTDDDRFDGNGTDGEGSRFYGKYQIMKNLQAGAAFFLDKKTISDPAKEANVNHLFVDLMASF